MDLVCIGNVVDNILWYVDYKDLVKDSEVEVKHYGIRKIVINLVRIDNVVGNTEWSIDCKKLRFSNILLLVIRLEFCQLLQFFHIIINA